MTTRARLALLAAATALSLASAAAAEAARYHGYVGPGFSIVLRNAAGARVTRIPAGRHTFVIHDRSTAHNFVLRRGTTRLRATSVAGTGRATWRVRIRAGAYVYFCAVHPELRGSFRAR